jgi:hypothetical protein
MLGRAAVLLQPLRNMLAAARKILFTGRLQAPQYLFPQFAAPASRLGVTAMRWRRPDDADRHPGLGGTRIRVALAMAGALILAAGAGAVAARASGPGEPAADQPARVGQVCQSVVGVRPGEEHYDVCVESLSESLRALGPARAISLARNDCLAKGLRPGSSALAVCELQSTATPPAAGDAPPTEPGGAKSYFSASPRDSFRREQLACAEVGFDPAGGAFDSCVASLRAALFSADNPMN